MRFVKLLFNSYYSFALKWDNSTGATWYASMMIALNIVLIVIVCVLLLAFVFPGVRESIRTVSPEAVGIGAISLGLVSYVAFRRQALTIRTEVKNLRMSEKQKVRVNVMALVIPSVLLMATVTLNLLSIIGQN